MNPARVERPEAVKVVIVVAPASKVADPISMFPKPEVMEPVVIVPAESMLKSSVPAEFTNWIKSPVALAVEDAKMNLVAVVVPMISKRETPPSVKAVAPKTMVSFSSLGRRKRPPSVHSVPPATQVPLTEKHPAVKLMPLAKVEEAVEEIVMMRSASKMAAVSMLDANVEVAVDDPPTLRVEDAERCPATCS